MDLHGDNRGAERFSEVLRALNRDRLPMLGRWLYLRHQGQLVSTPVVGEPIYGSNRVCFPLTFDDGLRWLVKIPINGTEGKWDAPSAWSFQAEHRIMRALNAFTDVPVSEVIDFCPAPGDNLRCPYIIVSHPPGWPLYDIWFGHHLNGDDPEVNYARRVRILDSIASAMVQLGRFTTLTSGISCYFRDGLYTKYYGRRRDYKAELDRTDEDQSDGPIYIAQPPLTDPKAYYTYMLDLHPETNSYQKCIVALLRKLIDWIPEPEEGRRGQRFDLTIPYFDYQDFIVSEEGDLRGIEWEGVATLPRSVGSASYPTWLTRDWNPTIYKYEEPMDQGVKPKGGVWEDSPSCLAYWRQFYRYALAKHGGDDGRIDLCRRSLIARNLLIAAENPWCRSDIVRKVTMEAWKRSGQDQELVFEVIVERFIEEREGKGEDPIIEALLHKGFDALLAEEIA
ncbi:hypothetical protein F5Y16DRAFT_271562 [Xylariaceae sp. FL0255]|nr:hypothetical protein F5Y16DRAFT_271562 [Xylariaceae sp. FL0255]